MSDDLREKIAAELSALTRCDGQPHPSELHYRQADALLPLIEAERQKARNETAKAIRNECLADRDSDYIEHTNAMEIAADIAAAHIKGKDEDQ